MARGDADHDSTPGGDSFLDIVANIVGILVLLVVVVGVRAGRDAAATATPKRPDTAEVVAAAKEAIREALVNRQDVARLVEQAVITQAEAALRDRVRLDLATYVATLRAELDAERAKLSAADQAAYDTSNQIAQAQLELDRLSRRQLDLAGAIAEEETESIEVDTTPIIRERVKDEVWVRLEGDLVAPLPMEELRDEVERVVRGAFSAGSSEGAVERVVGPVGGFVLRCALQRRRVRTAEGVYVVTGLRAARLETQGEPIIETVDDATRDGSHLLSRLAGVDPSKTVVTVVAYPDSFDTLPRLESELRRRGFRVAKALQPEGVPITFGPNGEATLLQ